MGTLYVRRFGEVRRGSFGTLLAVMGTCFGLGIAGIFYLEWSQGWRPGRRR